MNARLPLLAAAALSFLSLAPAQAATEVLLEEGFSSFNYVWTSSQANAKIGTSAEESFNADTNWIGKAVIRGQSGLRLGQASSFGYIVSTNIFLSGKGTTTGIEVSFFMAAQNANAEDKATLTLSIEGTDIVSGGYKPSSSEPATNTSYLLNTNTVLQKTWTISDVSALPNPFRIRFATSEDGRICIDQIVVTEIYSLGLAALDAPAPLSSSDIGFSGFTLSWTSVSGATGYDVTVTNANGATVFTGSYLPLERTATITGLAEGTTYAASVVAKGDGTTSDDSAAAELDVTTLTAPAVSAPNLTPTGVSPSSFMVSWPAQESASFSVRAWTLVPADVATEDFADYAADGTVPEGWTFQNSGNPYGEQTENPVDFRADGNWIGSPKFGGTVTNISFRLRRQSESGSTFTVYGSTGSADESVWKTAENTLATLNPLATQVYDIPVDASKGITRVFFQYTKSSGNVSIGSFSVKGTGVGKQPSYLTGYGPAAVAASATSVTISNPVAGETNFVEVTATGLTGRTATSTLPVPVPARPGVISVK